MQRAINCYQEALRFWTMEAVPLQYATLQSNLGSAYSDLPTGDRTANLTQAIACYQEALRFRTPEAAPDECRRTCRNLANLHFTRGEWKDALNAYNKAMEAGERLYRAGLSAESKMIEIVENVTLYLNAAFTSARCGQLDDALLILERGKTRMLAEALRLRIPRPANVPDEVWSSFKQAGTAVRAAQTGGNTKPGKEHDLVQAYATRVQNTQSSNTALDAAIKRVRIHDSTFLQKITMSTIKELLFNDHTILVAFCITSQGSMGFIVGRDQDIQMVEVPNFTQAKLQDLFAERDTDGRVIAGWLGAYDRSRIEDKPGTLTVWQETITKVLAELGQQLLIPILSTLPSSVEHVILLPSAELFLFPLHAVPLSGKNIECVCDRYQVSYAPSTEVLAEAQARILQRVVPDLCAVINPQADPRLVFTQIEGEAIAKFFSHFNLIEGRTGTKQNIVDGVRGRTYVHFACHGKYNWEVPAESALLLANGELTLAELQQDAVDLSAARLITLSACETGITDVVKGGAEEYIGIPAGFLLAGAPCVVSSLWAVPDLSTALLMERFYRNHLSDEMDIAAALREAQLWVRDLRVEKVLQFAEQWYRQSQQKEKRELFKLMRYYRNQAEQNPNTCPFTHPYYWAAFVVNGM